MVSRGTIVAAAALCHLSAITVAGIPPPRELEVDRGAAAGDSRAGSATLAEPVFDGLLGLSAFLWRVTEPVRPLARRYVRTIRLEQQWRMFSDPPDADQYARMRYHVAPRPGAQALWVDAELIFPIVPEDRYRPYTSAFFEEKAFRNARQRYLRNLRTVNTATRVADLPVDLVPFVRYYARRHRERELSGLETLVRAEIWFGVAPVPAPGAGRPALPDDRRDALRAYYARERMQGGTARTQLPVGTVEQEADIAWTLVYFEREP